MTLSPAKKNLLTAGLLVVLLAGGATYAWQRLHHSGPGEGFASGNGRIEATEVDVATKLGGRVDAILVNEGDFVSAGQPLAQMQILSLQAQREEAQARQQQSLSAVASAEAQVAVRESDYQAALAQSAQRESELDAARRRL
ncbi:biotin/lipoyl-binding protein, partial [Herbaspirillum frisingense]